jgi:hypothetical protein
MFATLVGGLPTPPDVGPSDAETVRHRQLAAQAEAGIELVSTGAARAASSVEACVDDWRRSATVAAGLGVAAKASLVGPFTAAAGAPDDQTVDHTAAVVVGLASAGCPFVEIHEPAATTIGSDLTAQARFRAAHDRLAAKVGREVDAHLCLAIVGGNADAAGAGTVLVPGYQSYLFDLILGPDNWRLVAVAPPGAGIVLGALDHRPGVYEVPETLVWAAHYAASTAGRGMERVGLSSAGALDELGWDKAVERLAVLGKGARLAAMPRGEELARSLDPRALDIRSAALGRYAPLRPKRDVRRGRSGR